MDGLVGVEKFKEVFKVAELPGDAAGSFETMTGFVMYRLGRIPRLADRVEAAGYRFEVIDMDGNRIDKLL